MGLTGSAAHASVVLGGTRVILDEKDKEATIRASNEGNTPALIQTWVDKGDPKASPTSIEVPFTVMPPVARIDPSKGQTLRVLYTGEPLPTDKESVFWLNVLEIPPKATGDLAEANRLQLAFRTRVKLFYRPTGLVGTAAEAPSRVTWRIKPAGKTLALEATNPTGYHVSYAGMDVSAGGKTVRNQEGGMIGPGETKTFPLDGEAGLGANGSVHYRAINDWGGPIEGDAPVVPAS
ncbi:pili assembly chaperone (plasmid) [Cupriavidus metallidurans CH34]|uniref:Pili assembly chaperone n=1 Tax=Cupriavidus metallidurans (strain ATCC 43123 / DSM 2839 / NBRC 102507 / CH34) TaxID=266264 RepID=Q1LDF4_CUPMC|nr:pili assembly chaperone [Cupriavidus metallidurans CH34]